MPTQAQVDEDGAEEALVRAESMLISAFDSVLEAEKMGFDATILSEELTRAGGHLTSALLLFKSHNFTLAKWNADICYTIAQSTKAESISLIDYPSLFSRFKQFYIEILSYILVCCAIILASVFSWNFFKRKYLKKVLKMHPEAVLT